MPSSLFIPRDLRFGLQVTRGMVFLLTFDIALHMFKCSVGYGEGREPVLPSKGLRVGIAGLSFQVDHE